MKIEKLGLIHTSATLVPVFADLCQAKLPAVKTFNIADDSLIKEVIERQELTRSVSRRVGSHVQAAQQAGADCILVTCSSIGPAVEAAAALADVPVLRVDQPMADKAVRMGAKIGVAATLRTTLEPTADLIRRRAQAAGKRVEINAQLCDGAFEALMSGDAAKHDQMVGETLRRLAAEVDVVVLAQASMARVADALDPSEVTTPVLSSPGLAIDFLAEQSS
ncbi:Asp/Glu/Hydantoin racemase [Posidoniimonas corsicana]|uniref:Asp/Glu/Hydantoin racemase n=1 Tax=Posidoniimonas corsicana TaxID=1938618 RepID=A0A5C5UTN5_9BACT|nr:aspartate/glutamate racemase family protein [Posidoniimonas corsicana]TWT29794.1 Asp/Glu/Hydantoin racemase [Posidoniimonas corsicana]